MRSIRNILLLAMVGAVAMALGPATTGAQTPTLEVVKESDNTHCPAVINSTTGGCLFRYAGEATLQSHFAGVEFAESDCNITGEGRIDEDGEGYIYTGLQQGDEAHTCTRQVCNLPWRVHMDEFQFATERVTFEACFQAVGGGNMSKCQVQPPLNEPVANHIYRFTFNDVNGVSHVGAECELTSGAWNFVIDAQHPAIEFLHSVPGRR
jgi:hypothetical protein